MRVAVVQTKDNVVVNIINAEVSDAAAEGCFHVDVDNTECGLNWIYDRIIGDFVNSNPDPVAIDPPVDP